MQLEDLILVSVDDHVVEPPDMFEGRVPAKYVDQAPKLVRTADGDDVWVFDRFTLPNVGLNAVVGRPPEEFGIEPTALSELRPGCYDINARVRDMDANGILGSMNFPSFPSFCGQLFGKVKDKDMALAMVRAYNDWHIDSWAGTHPGRIIPLAIPPLWDVELMAAEVRRVADKGCHAVTFSENPHKLGLPSLHDDYWDPFWAACSELGTVVCLHIGSSSQIAFTAPDAPIDVMVTLQSANTIQTAADLIWSPVLRKWRDLKIALNEGGIGWVPYFLQRIDQVFEQHSKWTRQDFGGMTPSELFNERVLLCFINDEVGLANRHLLNTDNIMFEVDYPHSDATWPRSPETVAPYLAQLPEDVVNKVSHQNAMRAFQYDPFVHIPKSEATVGALRAKAADWDITPKSVERAATLNSSGRGPRVMSDIMSMATPVNIDR